MQLVSPEREVSQIQNGGHGHGYKEETSLTEGIQQLEEIWDVISHPPLIRPFRLQLTNGVS